MSFSGRSVKLAIVGAGSVGSTLAYACLPVLDGRDRPVPGAGRELVIAAHTAAGPADFAARDRAAPARSAPS